MAVEFTCSDQLGMVVDPIGPGGWSQCVEHLQLGLIYGSTVWRGAGVRTVLYGDYL